MERSGILPILMRLWHRLRVLRIVNLGALSDSCVSGLLLGRRQKPAYTEKALVLSAHGTHAAETVPHTYACSIHRDLRLCLADDAVTSAHAFARAGASAHAPLGGECSRCTVAALWKENGRTHGGSPAGNGPDQSQSSWNRPNWSQPNQNQPRKPLCARQNCPSQTDQSREAEACARGACRESHGQRARGSCSAAA